MDIGILRLSRYLEGAIEVTAPGIFGSATNGSKSRIASWADYDIDSDFIDVNVELFGVSSAAPAEAGCRAILMRLSRTKGRPLPPAREARGDRDVHLAYAEKHR
jgi:hypothetical protein